MKIPITRNDLYSIDKQIQEIKQNQQALALLLFRQIEKFYVNAGPELVITKARFKSILNPFIEMNEAGELLTITDNKGNSKWKFKSSYALPDKTILFGAHMVEKRFNEEVEALMSQKIVIEI